MIIGLNIITGGSTTRCTGYEKNVIDGRTAKTHVTEGALQHCEKAFDVGETQNWSHMEGDGCNIGILSQSICSNVIINCDKFYQARNSR